MERHLMVKPWSPCCLLALLLAAPLRADPPAVPPHPTLVLQVGHSGGINTLADSPDGKTLATGGNDGVRLWDVPGGQLQSVLHGFYSIDSPAFSPDGRELATISHTFSPAGGGPDVVHLWDVGSGLPRPGLEGARAPFAFSPDGKTLTTGGDNNTVRLWDTASGRLRSTLQPVLADPQYDFVDAVVFSPESQTLVTETKDHAVQLWDVVNGRPKAALEGSWNPIFSPDSRYVSVAGGDGAVRLLDVGSGQHHAVLKGATSVGALSPDSKTLATVSYDQTAKSWSVQLWDVAGGQPGLILKDAQDPLAFSPDGQTLATTGFDESTGLGSVHLWDLAGGKLKATLQGHESWVVQIAFSPDGKMLATRDYSGKLLLSDVALGKLVPITAQTSLAQFPPEIVRPVSIEGPAVLLLDPVDEHVLATLQPLPDAPAYLAGPLPSTPLTAAIPTTGGEWITTTPDGYFEGSANLAQFIRWNVDGVLYPAAAYWDLYYRPDLVRQALKIPGG